MQEKNLKNFFQREMKSLIVPGMMLVLGLLFMILKAGIISALVIILGVMLITSGIALGFTLLSRISYFTIVFAALLILFGIICVTDSFGVSGFVIRIIGLSILVNALVRIFEERTVKGKGSFKAYMIVDGVTAALGLVLLIFPLSSVDAIFIVIGIFMLILGISNIISAYSFYKNGGYVNDGSDVVWEE
jgi:uncharacterized membrane protein HdeD (DUF308 family)